MENLSAKLAQSADLAGSSAKINPPKLVDYGNDMTLNWVKKRDLVGDYTESETLVFINAEIEVGGKKRYIRIEVPKDGLSLDGAE